jgi:hypothetical protein
MSNQHGLSRYHGFPRLRRAKLIPTDLFAEYASGDNPNEPKKSPSSTDSSTPGAVTHSSLLRVWFRSPWEDYESSGSARDSLAPRSNPTAEPVLAFRRTSYFSKASIRAFQSYGRVTMLEALSRLEHPNIANLFDIYLHNSTMFVASEYLELAFSELDFLCPPFEEWEIATVANEVWRTLQLQRRC